MEHVKLTLQGVEIRAVSVPLKRPIVSKVGRFDRWPLILIDLFTREGVVGRSYLEPYLTHSIGSIVPVLRHLVEQRIGRRVAPLSDFPGGPAFAESGRLRRHHDDRRRGARHGRLGRAGTAAHLPLAELLGGTVGEVPAYNSNGLWLSALDGLAEEAGALVSEGGFGALKLRLGRDRLADDLRRSAKCALPSARTST